MYGYYIQLISYPYYHLSTTINRENTNNINNPLYTGTVKPAKNDTTLSEGEEHIYDLIKSYDDNMNGKQEMKPKHKLPPNMHQNSLNGANRNEDCASIKSDEVTHDESRAHCMPDASIENPAYNKIPFPQSKPKVVKKPLPTPTSKAHRHMPTNKNLPHDVDYLVPDKQHSVGNQYASLDETSRAENNQYASLVARQHVAYQELAGRSLLSSEYTIPKKT